MAVVRHIFQSNRDCSRRNRQAFYGRQAECGNQCFCLCHIVSPGRNPCFLWKRLSSVLNFPINAADYSTRTPVFIAPEKRTAPSGFNNERNYRPELKAWLF